MNQETKIRSLSGKTFSEDEYRMLREEEKLRLEMINSHGFSVISLSLVFFSAILVFLGEIFELACNPNSVFGKNVWVDTFVILVVAIFGLLPVFLVYGLSAKYEDALRQIVSISAYFRVFYEFPSMIRENKNVLGWEMFHCNSLVPKAKLFNLEYFVISIASIVLSGLIALSLTCCAYITNGYFKHNIASSVGAFCVLILAYGIGMGFAICITVKTRKNTNTETIMSTYHETYLIEYLDVAEKSEFLSPDEVKTCKCLMEQMKTRDDKLFNNKKSSDKSEETKERKPIK